MNWHTVPWLLRQAQVQNSRRPQSTHLKGERTQKQRQTLWLANLARVETPQEPMWLQKLPKNNTKGLSLLNWSVSRVQLFQTQTMHTLSDQTPTWNLYLNFLIHFQRASKILLIKKTAEIQEALRKSLKCLLKWK